jgi:hypothetical protein
MRQTADAKDTPTMTTVLLQQKYGCLNRYWATMKTFVRTAVCQSNFKPDAVKLIYNRAYFKLEANCRIVGEIFFCGGGGELKKGI